MHTLNLISTAGGSQYLATHHSNTGISIPLTITILAITTLAILYVIVRVAIELRKDKEREDNEQKRKRAFINRILGKSKSNKVSKTNSPSDQE